MGNSRLVPFNGRLILSGCGIRLFVQNGHLCFEDGIGRTRRAGRLSRVEYGLKRLVIVGHSGFVTLESLRWLHDVGAAFIQIDADGQLISCAGPIGLDDARLRRSQALAAENGIGIEIARDLIGQKLAGQLTVLEHLRDREATSAIKSAIASLAPAATLDTLRQTEAQAASAYWGAWRYVDVVFKHRDAAHVPERWRAFGVRKSLLTLNPRKATNPANAILNYLYAILEAEARIAALAVGLDPGIGVMHADLRARDSLACDLMEAVRPAVDAYLLDLLQRRAFRKGDFFETREGVCRVMPTFTHELAETGSIWARELGPVTERVARVLFENARKTAERVTTSGVTKRLPTPLTESNRSAGREPRKRKPEPDLVGQMKARLFG